ncbi:MAG: hypothetical protein KC729_02615, partial [Candidatus Eisenbacteria bacterium]|nr:hypothetical protein [Candidatus Eisenbacteria bacterium]
MIQWRPDAHRPRIIFPGGVRIDWIPEKDRRFFVDAQTQSDLDVFEERAGGRSLFELLDSTRTRGGREKLRRLLAEPLSERPTLLARQSAIGYLGNPVH